MDQRVLQTQEWLNDTYTGVSGYTPITEDGATGFRTFEALIKALQIELGTTVDGDFGSGTLNACPATISQVPNESTATPTNLHYIIQGSMWCKGYNPGGFNGIFGASTASGIINFQADAGITQDGILKPYILQALMNTDGYAFEESSDPYVNYKHQVQMGLNQYYGSRIGLTAPNGLWERKSHKNLIKAVQTEWGSTPVDGIFGDGTLALAPTLSRNTSGYANSKRLLQWSLAVNGYYPGGFTGTFGNGTYNAVYNFQAFVCIGADGIAGKKTWASLLKSCGDTSRTATACDTSTRLTPAKAITLVNAGYDTVGRYLTKVEGGIDKNLTMDEIEVLQNAGLKVFPIFQTTGNSAEYFTYSQGMIDAIAAKNAAKQFGFPSYTVIYFAADYDVLTDQIESNIIPYFRGVYNYINGIYRIGVYGPRSICTELKERGYCYYSFVSDMSSGFTGNIGQKLPDRWAYDQFCEMTIGSGDGLIAIDKCAASPRATAISASLIQTPAPQPPPVEPADEFDVFETLYNLADAYESASSILEKNLLVLQFLRHTRYNSSSWDITAGSIDDGFISYVASQLPDLNPEDIQITEPLSQDTIEITHLAATINALLYRCTFPYSAFEDQIDNLMGWAGDLLQLGATLQNTLDNSANNYFNANDVYNFIGIDPVIAQNSYTFYDDAGNVIIGSTGGFDWIDFIQDIDAVSLFQQLSDDTIYNVMQNYYLRDWNGRFSRFEEYVIERHESWTGLPCNLKDVAWGYTYGTYLSVQQFSNTFGTFNYSAYGELLAEQFANKIAYYKSQE